MEIKAAIQLLELNVPITKAALKKAYRDALMVWHPDRFVGNTELKAKAEGRTYQINEAYALLSRIPESDYPYRASAGVQRAKQPPPAKSERASTGPPPRAEPSKPQPSSPPQPAAAAPPPKQPKADPAKKKADFLTVAAWVICVPAVVFLIVLITQLQSPKNSASQTSGGIVHETVPPVPITRATPDQTIEAMRVRAQQGDKEAQYQVGKAYAEGAGVVKDEKVAFQWFKSAANQGHDVAQASVGECYARGHGISQNMVEALKWYRKAAEQGNAAAQFNVGLAYGLHRGVPYDAVEAVKWYRKAAEQGFAESQSRQCFKTSK